MTRNLILEDEIKPRAPLRGETKAQTVPERAALYLFLLTRERVDYDEYKGCIVAARTAQDAISIHPSGNGVWADGEWRDANGWELHDWVAPANVTVTRVGVASPDTKAGSIVLSSFRHG